MRKLNYSLVDVFTERPLAGSPLAVFTLSQPLPDFMMQRIARELHLAETAFVCPTGTRATASLRVFSPTREVPFAANPAVGAAYVIGRSAPIGLLRFETAGGPVDTIIEREGGFVSRCVMSQPVPTWRDVDIVPSQVRAALGVEAVGVVREGSNGPTFLLVEVASIDAVTPDHDALAKLPHPVAVYERPTERAVRQRLFAARGEEPVAGALAGMVAQRLLLDGVLAKGELTVAQGEHMGRPGSVWAYVAPDQPPHVGGACASVARGTMELPFS